jgi:RNA polymerase sigma-70 factor (ECF subfamily)
MSPLASIAPKLYKRELMRYLHRRLRDPSMAEDLAQDVFTRLVTLKEERLIENPLAYIYGVASHILADHRIEHEQEVQWITVDSEAANEAAEYAEQGFLPDDLADRLNLQQQIDRAMNGLPNTHREVILAHKQDGMSYDEVAEKLGLSIHTVEKYVTQAKRKLRDLEWER